MRKRIIAASILAATLAVGGIALAAETITYTYDAKGRLVRVEHSGSVNSGVITNYTFDNADNQTNKQVTGAP